MRPIRAHAPAASKADRCTRNRYLARSPLPGNTELGHVLKSHEWGSAGECDMPERPRFMASLVVKPLRGGVSLGQAAQAPCHV